MPSPLRPEIWCWYYSFYVLHTPTEIVFSSNTSLCLFKFLTIKICCYNCIYCTAVHFVPLIHKCITCEWHHVNQICTDVAPETSDNLTWILVYLDTETSVNIEFFFHTYTSLSTRVMLLILSYTIKQPLPKPHLTWSKILGSSSYCNW